MKKGVTHQRRAVKVEIEIPFHDVDGWKMVWHGHYFKYFEIARTAYLRSIGFDADEMSRSGYVWPVIESQCRYVASARYGMRIVVQAVLADATHRVKFNFTVTDKKTGERLAYGHTVQAAVNVKSGDLCLMTPPVFLRHLRSKPLKSRS